MNLSLLKSIHGLIALLICAGFVAWLVILGASPGARAGSDVVFMLTSGWFAFAFMIVACLYSARKYMHKLGYSPELKVRVQAGAIERCESKLNEIRRRITKGFLKTEDEVIELAERVLKETGVGRVMQVHVETDSQGRITLETRPPERLGRMLAWLQAHAYYGLFSGVLVFLHGAGSLQSPMGVLLNVLTALVILTGVVGIFLFAVGPTWLTRSEKSDMNFEDVFVLHASLGEKIAAVEAKFDEDSPLRATVAKAKSARRTSDLSKILDATLRTEEGEKNSALLQDLMVLVGQRLRARQSLQKLMRIRFWMNIWRAIHVPASILLMAIVIGHVISVWVY